MRKVLFGSGLLAACIAGSANAAFLGWAANSYQVGDFGVIDVYGMVSEANDNLTNVYNANISLIGASVFNHTNSPANRWNPNTGSATGWDIDSFVTIGWNEEPEEGVPPGNGNTSGDPSFLNYNNNSGGAAPTVGAGWFNSAAGSPVAAQEVALTDNDTGGTLGVWVGRFVVSNPQEGLVPRSLVFSARAGVNTLPSDQISRTFDYFKIPTPGALALLGLAGLAGRRRRA